MCICCEQKPDDVQYQGAQQKRAQNRSEIHQTERDEYGKNSKTQKKNFLKC